MKREPLRVRLAEHLHAEFVCIYHVRAEQFCKSRSSMLECDWGPCWSVTYLTTQQHILDTYTKFSCGPDHVALLVVCFL
eukprot:s3321_g3.t1